MLMVFFPQSNLHKKKKSEINNYSNTNFKSFIMVKTHTQKNNIHLIYNGGV